ncbi:nucleoside diphosphate kinase regulator [Pseudobdellovibrio sp. HCB154]|uniref:nucleoside diphosphate kinase regulator n=1 Tax=Pseudobdellovibrio sp. HCB154 TaxID=3386277 RepID=UPI0039174546
MLNNEKPIITQTNREKIASILPIAREDIAALLEEELERATIVSDEDLPTDVVSMDSTVKFLDLETNKESIVQLVFPQDTNIAENKISILTPVGSALIGLRVGQTINWPFPNGKMKQLKVTSVTK